MEEFKFIKTFLKERDEALLSPDKKQIEEYLIKYQVPLPKDELIFWAGVHKARLGIQHYSEDVKNVSKKWLSDNGFSE